MRELQTRPDLGVGFAGQRLVEQGQHFGVGAQRHFLSGLPAHLALAGEQAERGQRGRQLAAHTVVDADRLGGLGGRVDLGIARGVEHALTVDDHQAFADQRQRVVGQRLEYRQRFFRRGLGECGDGRNLAVRVFGRQRLEQ
jgi:hypothetical protein